MLEQQQHTEDHAAPRVAEERVRRTPRRRAHPDRRRRRRHHEPVLLSHARVPLGRGRGRPPEPRAGIPRAVHRRDARPPRREGRGGLPPGPPVGVRRAGRPGRADQVLGRGPQGRRLRGTLLPRPGRGHTRRRTRAAHRQPGLRPDGARGGQEPDAQGVRARRRPVPGQVRREGGVGPLAAIRGGIAELPAGASPRRRWGDGRVEGEGAGREEGGEG
mmetsp:Transcript_30718/g.70192  ORF Transcript_30718/g.70192 Transcript_30718/m.70192 type:complete len:217 (+) Transcript_30718:1718-2368(+)